MSESYQTTHNVPLYYLRIRGGSLVTGLTVTVTVVNAATGASLLASTSCPETSVGSGIYAFSWAHGLTSTTECIATYTVGSFTYQDSFTLSTMESQIESDTGQTA